MKIRLLSLLFFLVNAVIMAANDVTIDNLTYRVDEQYYTADLISASKDKTGSLTVPSLINLGDQAYVVRGIGDSVFYCSKYTSIDLPNTLQKIGSDAFNYCTQILNIHIPNSVTSFGSRAFNKVCNITYKGNLRVDTLGARCVNGCIEDSLVYADSTIKVLKACPHIKYGNITLPNTVERIDTNAFLFCYLLNDIVLPDSLKEIKANAFNSCYSLTITIPEHINKIEGSTTFSYVCNVNYSGTNTDILRSIKYSKPRCINGVVDGDLIYSDSTKNTLCACRLSAIGDLIIPSGVEVINENAIYQCLYLTSIHLPQSITKINDSFISCTGINDVFVDWANENEIVIPDKNETFSYIAEGKGPKEATLHVPAGTKNIYMQKNIWKEFGVIVENATGIKSVNAISKAKKIIINGNPYIIVNGIMYSTTGQTIK